jgi:hypothetical protein
VWVLAFFVMGMLMGLLLLLLQQQGEPSSWLAFDWPGNVVVGEIAQKVGQTTKPKPEPRPEPVNSSKVEPMRCDRAAARAVRDKARELATISEKGDALQLRLGGEWEYYLPGHRRGFIEAFAEADRCLQGNGRVIRFIFRGEEVAAVNAEGAVELK